MFEGVKKEERGIFWEQAEQINFIKTTIFRYLCMDGCMYIYEYTLSLNIFLTKLISLQTKYFSQVPVRQAFKNRNFADHMVEVAFFGGLIPKR